MIKAGTASEKLRQPTVRCALVYEMSKVVEERRSPNPKLCKKRFEAVRQCLFSRHGDTEQMHETIEMIKGILRFDPDASTYTDAQALRIQRWRDKKQQATGQTVYEITGMKAAYQRKKESKD